MISLIGNYQIQLNHKTEELLGINLIKPLLESSYLPYTNSSIRPYNMACILNDLALNNRKRILEFGSGISTILMARLIKQCQFATEIISVEHDTNWIQFLQRLIQKEKLEKMVDIVYAPLSKIVIFDEEFSWYRLEDSQVDRILDLSFDMIIVDGPPAWEKDKQESRFPALPMMINNLTDDGVFYLDDANRTGERTIIEKWEKLYNIKFNYFGSLAFFNKSKSFNPMIY